MMEFFLKAKLHRATITEADLTYEGSISIDSDLMDAVGLKDFERVHIYNINNGERFETYVIRKHEKGIIGLNGAAARKGLAGDKIIIVSYCMLDSGSKDTHTPKIALLDDENWIKQLIDR